MFPDDYLYGEVSAQVLRQGDIILLEGLLGDKFNSFFPGIIKPDQKRFVMVLSQCCDLYKDDKGRNCKIEHINICILSSFEKYLTRMVDSFSKKKQEFHLITEEQYEGLSQKLFKLINNSDPKNYLFLPKTTFFETDMVAVISVNYPLRIEHYEDLLNNRVGTLNDQFRGKLGYTMGKLYSRIATNDLAGHESDIRYFIDCSLEKIHTTRISCEALINEIMLMECNQEIEILLKLSTEKQLKKERGNKKKVIISFLNSYIYLHYPEIAKLFPDTIDNCNKSEFRKKISDYLKANVKDQDVEKLFPEL